MHRDQGELVGLVIGVYVLTSVVLLTDRVAYPITCSGAGFFLWVWWSRSPSTARVLSWWWGWVLYGWLWKDYGASLHVGVLISCCYTFLGLFVTFREVPPFVMYCLYIILWFMPYQSNLMTEMEPWDVLLHLTLWFLSVGLYCYVELLSKRELKDSMDVLFFRTWWVLMASKWTVPFVGVQWIMGAFAITEHFSRRPVESPAEESVAPAPMPPKPPPPPPAKQPPRWAEFQRRGRPQAGWAQKLAESRPRGGGARVNSQLKRMMDKGAAVSPV